MSKSWSVIKILMTRDMHVLRQTLASDLIDVFVLLASQAINYIYFLPLFGMQSSYKSAMLIGTIGSFLINTIFDCALTEAADVSFHHFVRYQMTLPLSLGALFIQKMLNMTISLVFTSLPVIIFVLVYQYHGLTLIGFLCFIVMYLIALVLAAATALLLAYGPDFFWFIDNVWMRILMPVLFFGCHYFPWYALYNVSHHVSILYCISPLTYILEGMRGALMGFDTFIPYPLCLVIVNGVTALVIWQAYRVFVRKLYA